MNRNGSSSFIRSTGPRDDAIIAGVRWLISEAKKAGNTGIVAVSTKANLDNIANWSQLAALFTSLRQSERVAIEGVTLHLVNLKSNRPHTFNGPVLVIYGGQELLDAVDSIAGSSPVLYIPWEGDEFANWAQTWQATELGKPAAETRPQTEPTSGTAYFALKSLTNDVNLNTGITHPSDRESAIRTLETLFHKGAPITPETIRQQLIRLGWEPKDASKVKELAEMIWEGRRPKKSTGRADDQLWNYWNSKAN
ncbi:MAG TPA: hypothetical protein VHX65_14505 [Pirellulales bacterium]|jgi:hypothetical protein|nr:hypothetical protein [Pirellulales bacterium]